MKKVKFMPLCMYLVVKETKYCADKYCEIRNGGKAN